ncbi:MAG: helix-turn-helix domain-containing protein [Alicyclobacillaceae bacterium]|nr:helix-turn-helix domain-containing protein [Alicyclobacillaceae bacterium]
MLRPDSPPGAHLRGRERLHRNLQEAVQEITRGSQREDVIQLLLNLIGQIFQCNVGVVYLRENADSRMYPHVRGAMLHPQDRFSELDVTEVCPRMLAGPFRWPSDETDPIAHGCALFQQMDRLGFSTWFSLPLRLDDTVIGFIAVAYYRYQYLFDDVGRVLWEFAQDVARALLPYMPAEFASHAPPMQPTGEDPSTQQREWMQRFLSSYYELTNSLWTTDNLAAMTESLRDIIQQPVAVLDRFAGLMSRSPNDNRWNVPLSGLRKWLSQNRVHHSRPNPLAVRTDVLRGATFVVSPIQIGSALLGYLVVWEKSSKLDDISLITVQQAAMVLAVHFYKHGLHIEQRGNRFQELMNQLLDQPESWSRAHSAQALALGWDVHVPYRVLVATLHPPAAEELEASAPSEQIPSLFTHVFTRLSMDFPQVFLSRRRAAWVFVLPDAQCTDSFLTQFVQWVRGVVAEWMHWRPEGAPATAARDSYPELSFGLSHPAQGPAALRHAFHIGYIASRLAKTVAPNEPFARPEHVRVHTLILPLCESETTRLFVDEMLGPLVRHDAQHQTTLVETLRTFLRHHGNLSAAAAELYIHRTTLQYRLRRIESMLGRSLDAPDTRFELQLAIILSDLSALM